MKATIHSLTCLFLLFAAAACAESDPAGALSSDPSAVAHRPGRQAAANVENEWFSGSYTTEICGEPFQIDERVHVITNVTKNRSGHTTAIYHVTFTGTAANLSTGVVYQFPEHQNQAIAGNEANGFPYTNTFVNTAVVAGPGGPFAKIYTSWKVTFDANGVLRVDRERTEAECFNSAA